jgi:hypothetical protein
MNEPMEKYAELTDAELAIVGAPENQGRLDFPRLFSGGSGPRRWALADELRAWRASQSTSQGK